MIAEYTDDQTFFSEEEPLFTEHQKKRAIKPLEPQKPKTLVFVLIGLVFLLVVLAALAVIFGRRGQGGTQEPVSITPTPEVQTSSQIDILMSELKDAAQTADPTVNSLPFPPVLEEVKVSQ